MEKLIPAPKDADLNYIAPRLRNNAVKIESIILDPQNPRRGDVELIAKSLDRHGQQQPVTVYRFPISPEHPEDGYTVIAGNHRCKGALLELEYEISGKTRVKKPWKYISVSEYIGTPQEAQEYAIIDNRSSDVAEYDNKILARHLRDISEANADTDLYDLTGYDKGELTYHLSRMEIAESQKDAQKIETPIMLDKEKETDALKESTKDANLVSTNFNFNVDAFLDKEHRYPIFASSNDFGIPDLLPHMLAEVPDKPIRVWPGYTHRTAQYIKKYEKNKDYWIVNFGVSSQNAPYKRSYLCFYAFDEVFESLYTQPEKYAKNFLNTGIRAIIEPDFSTWDIGPLALNLWSNFRQRWLSRYYQEIGIKIVPNIATTIDGNYLHMFESLPAHCPLVALQIQSEIKKNETYFANIYQHCIELAMRHVSFDAIIVYGSKLGHKISQNWFPKDKKVIRVATVQDVRRQTYHKDPLHSVKTTDYN